MRHIRDYFKKYDPKLFAYIEKIELGAFSPPRDLFAKLCDSIISQQLSGRAADTIYARLEKLFPKGKITAQGILKLSESKIRSCGTSGAKTRSLKDLALKVADGTIDLDTLGGLTDEEVIVELTKVKGIGPWTAEMFLMFALGREDVFSHGDLGLRKAIQKIYGFKNMPTRSQIERIVKKWSPYRTYASRVLWKSLEIK